MTVTVIARRSSLVDPYQDRMDTRSVPHEQPPTTHHPAMNFHPSIIIIHPSIHPSIYPSIHHPSRSPSIVSYLEISRIVSFPSSLYRRYLFVVYRYVHGTMNSTTSLVSAQRISGARSLSMAARSSRRSVFGGVSQRHLSGGLRVRAEGSGGAGT